MNDYRRIVAVLVALAFGVIYMNAPTVKPYGKPLMIDSTVLVPRLVFAGCAAVALLFAEPWAIAIKRKAPRAVELGGLALLGAVVVIGLLVWLL